MTIAILATGDEIIHGDTLNTNGHAIAKALSSEGLSLGLHLSCADKEAALVESIRFLSTNHAILISIGGLGPTSDDRTRFAFAHHFGLDLVEYPEAVEHIRSCLERLHLPMDPGNRQQALFPPGASLLPNPYGTAMGCIFWANEILCILLPGPPKECLPMFNDHVMPRLQLTQHSQKQVMMWQLFGVSEGQVAEKLETALAGVPCRMGYRLDMPYLEFKVFCEEPVAERIKAIVTPLVTPYIISPPKTKASQLLLERLAVMKDSVGIVDRVTGGVLEMLIRHPKTDTHVSFHNHMDATCYFDIDGLDEFWGGESLEKGTLRIKYRLHDQHGFETHTFPYRSRHYILGHAAEWLCFRIFHLLDEFH